MQPDDEMIIACAELRARCQETGHGLGDKVQTGDSWIAATAIRVDVPLVSHDGVFEGAPGLGFITANSAL